MDERDCEMNISTIINGTHHNPFLNKRRAYWSSKLEFFRVHKKISEKFYRDYNSLSLYERVTESLINSIFLKDYYEIYQ